MTFVPVRDLAKGKWPSILAAIGVPKEYLGRKHGPCPFCGDGKDRFRFDDKEGSGSFICGQCGAGNGVDFVMRWLKVEFKEAAREIEKHVGSARPIRIRQGRDEAVVKDEMNSIWRQAKGLGEVRAAAEWWVRRVGLVPQQADLRAHPRLLCPGAPPSHHPAMVAKIRDADGHWVSLHRTYLAPGGQKARVDSPRRVMDRTLPDGCAIRLGQPSDVLGIAEGIETAMAAAVLFGFPVWATINAVMLEKWQPPEGVRVVVFGDNDASFTGHAAAYNLARRLKAKKVAVEVRIPPAVDTDWNDELLARQDTSEAA